MICSRIRRLPLAVAPRYTGHLRAQCLDELRRRVRPFDPRLSQSAVHTQSFSRGVALPPGKRAYFAMIRTSSVLVLAFVVALGLSGAGVVRAATPSIRSIGPSVISVGDPDFSLRVQGENFDKTAVVLLDGD